MYELLHLFEIKVRKFIASLNKLSIPIAIICPANINERIKFKIIFARCASRRAGTKDINAILCPFFYTQSSIRKCRIVLLSYSLFIRKLLLQIHVFLFIYLYSKVKSHFSKITHSWIQHIFIVITKQSSTWYVYIIWLARGLCIRERPLINRLRNNKITIFNIPTFNITALKCRWILIHKDLVFRIIAHSIPKRSIQREIYHRHSSNSLISTRMMANKKLLKKLYRRSFRFNENIAVP